MFSIRSTITEKITRVFVAAPSPGREPLQRNVEIAINNLVQQRSVTSATSRIYRHDFTDQVHLPDDRRTIIGINGGITYPKKTAYMIMNHPMYNFGDLPIPAMFPVKQRLSQLYGQSLVDRDCQLAISITSNSAVTIPNFPRDSFHYGLDKSFEYSQNNYISASMKLGLGDSLTLLTPQKQNLNEYFQNASSTNKEMIIIALERAMTKAYYISKNKINHHDIAAVLPANSGQQDVRHCMQQLSPNDVLVSIDARTTKALIFHAILNNKRSNLIKHIETAKKLIMINDQRYYSCNSFFKILKYDADNLDPACLPEIDDKPLCMHTFIHDSNPREEFDKIQHLSIEQQQLFWLEREKLKNEIFANSEFIKKLTTEANNVYSTDGKKYETAGLLNFYTKNLMVHNRVMQGDTDDNQIDNTRFIKWDKDF